MNCTGIRTRSGLKHLLLCCGRVGTLAFSIFFPPPPFRFRALYACASAKIHEEPERRERGRRNESRADMQPTDRDKHSMGVGHAGMAGCVWDCYASTWTWSLNLATKTRNAREHPNPAAPLLFESDNRISIARGPRKPPPPRLALPLTRSVAAARAEHENL